MGLSTIRSRVMVSVGGVLLVLIIVFNMITLSYSTAMITQREMEYIQKQTQIGKTVLESWVGKLPAATRDWSSWDETYAFVQGKNPDFAATYLTDYPLKLHNLNMLTILDINGDIVYERFYDYETNTYINPNTHVKELHPIINATVLEKYKNAGEIRLADTLQIGYAGFYSFSGDWFFISAFPIIPSDETGEAIGTFIFGREINGEDVISGIAGENITAHLYSRDDPLLSHVSSELIEKGFAVSYDETGQYVYGWSVMYDFFGNASLVLGVSEPRSMFESEMRSANLMVVNIVIISIFIILILFFILNRLVLKPLSMLSEYVDLIGANSSAEHIDLKKSGGLEFQRLLEAINGMLRRQAKWRKALETSNRELRIYSRAVDSASEEIVIYNQGESIEHANAMFMLNNGYEAGKPIEDNIYSIICRDNDALATEIRRALYARQAWNGEITMNRADIVERYEANISNIKGSGDNHVLLIMRSIEQQKRFEETLLFMAQVDTLTELPNRGRFHEKLSGVLVRAREAYSSAAVLFADMDGFKNINDAVGHSAGDQIIYSIAERISGRFASEAQCVARMGGDEFAIVFSDLTIDEVNTKGAELLKLFEDPFTLDTGFFTLSASVGSSIYPYDGEDCDTLIKNAEIAMYNSKAHGKNMHTPYSIGLADRASERVEMENALRASLENKDDFELYYQPIVYSDTGEIQGYEALIRWKTKNGIVLPDRFIPLAEETGLIVPISWWALEQACRANGEIQRLGLAPYEISINIPAQVLTSSEFLTRVKVALEENDMLPQLLKIEITESTFIVESVRSNDVVKSLVDMGVTVAIDDFGTGYSSLSYLKKLKLDNIKIDRSFISDLPEDIESTAIVKAIIAIAQSLGLTTTAEGVETMAQAKDLSRLGCTLLQGYLISKPLPFGRLIEFIENWNPRIIANALV